MTPPLRVCHVTTADLWAGAEVQLATLASYLVERDDLRVSAVVMNEGRLAAELSRLGVAVSVIDERRASAAAIFRFLVRHFREHEVDVVHCHRYKDGVLGLAAAKLAGVPLAVRTVHGLPEPRRGWDRLKEGVYR